MLILNLVDCLELVELQHNSTTNTSHTPEAQSPNGPTNITYGPRPVGHKAARSAEQCCRTSIEIPHQQFQLFNTAWEQKPQAVFLVLAFGVGMIR